MGLDWIAIRKYADLMQLALLQQHALATLATTYRHLSTKTVFTAK